MLELWRRTQARQAAGRPCAQPGLKLAACALDAGTDAQRHTAAPDVAARAARSQAGREALAHVPDPRCCTCTREAPHMLLKLAACVLARPSGTGSCPCTSRTRRMSLSPPHARWRWDWCLKLPRRSQLSGVHSWLHVCWRWAPRFKLHLHLQRSQQAVEWAPGCRC